MRESPVEFTRAYVSREVPPYQLERS